MLLTVGQVDVVEHFDTILMKKDSNDLIFVFYFHFFFEK